MRYLRGVLPEDDVQKDCIKRLIKIFHLKKEILIYSGKVSVPLRTVKDVLFEAQDARVGGYFGSSKTLAIFSGLHWKHKAQDVSRYFQGSLKCQQKKDGTMKKLGYPTNLDVPKIR